MTLHQIGVLAQGQNQPSEARDWYMHSLEILREVGDGISEERTLAALEALDE